MLTEPMLNDSCRQSATQAFEQEFASLARRIEDGDKEAAERLYILLESGLRFYICRRVDPQEIEDKLNETFLAVLVAIRSGRVRDRDHLAGFAHGVARHCTAQAIDARIKRRGRESSVEFEPLADPAASPEQVTLINERREITNQILAALSTRDREILTRFYLLEQSKEQIRDELNLTETQFRLAKSRAKNRFATAGLVKTKRRDKIKPLPPARERRLRPVMAISAAG